VLVAGERSKGSRGKDCSSIQLGSAERMQSKPHPKALRESDTKNSNDELIEII
jgi:hypothetical protein